MKCAICDKRTWLTITTWFSAGPVQIGDTLIPRTGVEAPVCDEHRKQLLSHAGLDAERDYIHVLLY